MGRVGKIRSSTVTEASASRSVPSFNNEPNLVRFLRGREIAPLWVRKTLHEVQREQQHHPHTPIALVRIRPDQSNLSVRAAPEFKLPPSSYERAAAVFFLQETEVPLWLRKESGWETETVSYDAAQRIVAAGLQVQDAAHHSAHTSPADGTTWTRRMLDEQQHELLADLAKFPFLDITAATLIPRGCGWANWGSLFVPFRLPSEASDYARTHHLLASHLLVPLELYFMETRWWVRSTREGVDFGVPFDVPEESLQKLHLELWKYYGRNAISAEMRTLATRTHRLATMLSTQGYFVDKEDFLTLGIAHPGLAHWANGDLGFPNPFLMDDNCMTPWSDFPAAVRAAVLAVIPEEELAGFMVHRIFREMEKGENFLPGRYLPIAEDAWTLPTTLRDRVYDLIPKPVRPLWSHWLTAHDPSRPLAEHSATLFLGPEPPRLDPNETF